MRVKLIRETTRQNPDFDRSKEVSRENHPLTKLPIGTTITSPEAFKLCLTNPQYAEPDDPEAVEKIRQIRPELLERRTALVEIPTAPPIPNPITTPAGDDAETSADLKSEEIPARKPRIADPVTKKK